MNRFLIVITIAAFGFQPFFTQAQSTPVEPRSTITVNAGSSLIGTFFGLFVDGFDSVNENDEDVDFSRTPVLQVAYDYQIQEWFSVGGAVSFQNFSIDSNEGNADVNRLNIGARGLFHYGKNPNLDMYSGIRVGLNNWDTSVKSATEEFEEDFDSEFNAFGTTLQVIGFGIRGYFNENIGLNMELAFGGPHYLSVGANYRF